MGYQAKGRGYSQILINADDLGINREVSTRIFSLMARQALRSASLLANGEATEWAAAETPRYPRCSFGVHLNLTEFSPLTAGQGLEPILDAHNRFEGNGRSIRHACITASLCEAIYREWCAQVERLLLLGVKISHLDSHHHTHTIPGLFWMLKRVQAQYKIRKVRITRNIYFGRAVSPLLLAKKAAWNWATRHYYATKTTRGFTSFKEFHQLLRSGHPLRQGTVELMVHPGMPGFEDETQLLAGSWGDQLREDTELISYHDL
jgi:predicted glycoside hydrolase/deacetylase ChbG (UPF0249 family)